ncbi:MAG: CBS domain-containing protein [Bdellovibrionia bacterium]
MTLKLSQYMSTRIHTIGKTLPIETARKQMTKHKIHHLPVLEAGKLVGIISDRDIQHLVSFQPAKDLTVGDVMAPDPYIVSPNTHLAEVAEKMARHRFESAIVQENEGNLVGIFTCEDAMRALADVIRDSKAHDRNKAA